MSKAGILSLAITIAATIGAAGVSATAAAGSVLSGKIVDAATGAPVNAASITVKGTPLRTSSEGDGTFVIRDVPAGVAVIEVDRPGYRRRELSVSVTPGDPTAWTIALTKAKQ